LASHFPQVKAVIHLAGIDWSHAQWGQRSNTISAKHDWQMAFTASSATLVGIMQSGQVR
jgi:hypothetical protein